MNERNFATANRGQYADSPSVEPKQSIIATLCNANAASLRVLDALLALQCKLGILEPAPSSANSAQIQRTPSVGDISSEINSRLQYADKLVCEIHAALGDQ